MIEIQRFQNVIITWIRGCVEDCDERIGVMLLIVVLSNMRKGKESTYLLEGPVTLT